MPQTMGTAGKPINQPTVTCRGSNGSEKKQCGFEWIDAPDWNCPMANGNAPKTYNVKVKGNGKDDGGDCRDKGEVICGTLTVDPPSSSSIAPSSSSNAQGSSSASNNYSSGSSNLDEEPWIPVSTRLAVRIVSKEISKQKTPTDAEIEPIRKTILVMPRVVFVEPHTDLSGAKFNKYYSYMPLNGAKKADTTTSPPVCAGLNPENPAEGIYTCWFDGTQIYHSPFYLRVGNPIGVPLPPAGGATCKLAGSIFTHGKNVDPVVSCSDKKLTPTNIDYEEVFGPPLAIDEKGNHYYPGPEEKNAMISVSGKCGEIEFDETCYSEGIGGDRNYNLEIKQPTCYFPPGPYESKCTGTSGWQSISCTQYNGAGVPPPTHDCGTASKDSNIPYFNYSSEEDATITATNIQWNIEPVDGGPKNQNFNSTGINRKVRMFEVSCGGHRLFYGTRNGGGIECGKFDVILEGSSANYQIDLPACRANVRCTTNNYCGGSSVPAPEITCNNMGTPSNAVFKYTSPTNRDSLSSTTLTNWNNGENQNVSSTREVFLQQVTCGETTYKCGTGSNSNKGLSCGMVEIKNDCSNITATCKLMGNTNALTVTQGQNISPPIITCSNGVNPSDVQFTSSSLPKDNVTGLSAFEWLNNAHYGANNDSASYRIYAALNCGDKGLNIECGTITVNKPTCSSPTGDYVINTSTVPPPTYSCGNASASNPKFNYTGAGNGTISGTLPESWNATPQVNNLFRNLVTDRHVYMYQINCDGHTLNFGTSSEKNGVHCSGSFNIVNAP